MIPTNISESERLAANQRALLETLPNLVLLLNIEGTVEYMNPNALMFFDNRTTQKDLISKNNLNPVLKSLTSGKRESVKTQKVVLKNKTFNCHITPFTGYNGDDLFWFILQPQENDMRFQAPPLESPEKSTMRAPVKMVGSSSAIQNLINMISRVAPTDTTVLINGESGTGKELVANLICEKSKRAGRPFLTINCNAINDQLLESDLFGYEKGAFTGATSRTKGKFEVVDGGTIFLDEIGDISPRMQAVLLRVIQHGEIMRVGGTAPIQVNVRVLAATNHDLVKAVKEGTFRLDLFYRLNIFNITIPPLRERKDDIPELTAHFVKKFSDIFDRVVDFRSKDVLDTLSAYDWPGNIRELENVIQRAILMCEDNTINISNLTFDMPMTENKQHSLSSVIEDFEESGLKGIVDMVEKEVIVDKLQKFQGNVAKTAEKLQMSNATLYEKMKRYSISAKELR